MSKTLSNAKIHIYSAILSCHVIWRFECGRRIAMTESDYLSVVCYFNKEKKTRIILKNDVTSMAQQASCFRRAEESIFFSCLG